MLTQATQKIDVFVHKTGGGGFSEGAGTGAKEHTASTQSTTSGSSLRKTLLGSDSPARQRRVIITNATHAFAVTKQTIWASLNYKAGGIAYETGDEAQQDMAQRTIEVVQDVGGFASSVGMGAVYGAWGGPLGSLLGATMAGTQKVVSTGLKYKGRARDYDIKMFKENNSIAYSRARANINLTTGRLR